MKKLLALMLLLFSTATVADSLTQPNVLVATDEHGRFLVRISRVKDAPIASIFEFDYKSHYKFIREFKLVNPYFPRQVGISEVGEIVTLDDWYGRGINNVIVLYKFNGELIKSYTLAELYPEKNRIKFSESASGVFWRCPDSRIYFKKNIINVNDVMGGHIELSLADGSFTYFEGGEILLCVL